MALIFECNNESDLSEWDFVETGAGNLYWAAAAALAGSSGGIEVYQDDTTNRYVQKNFSTPTSGLFRCRFYFDPNTMNTANRDEWVLAQLRDATTSCVQIRAGERGGVYWISADYRPDGSSFTTLVDESTITDAEHYIEFRAKKASTSSSNDGEMTVWIDGTQVGATTSWDLYDGFDIVTFRAGSCSNQVDISPPPYYMDQFKAIDDDTMIGPYSAGTVVPVIMHHRRILGFS